MTKHIEAAMPKIIGVDTPTRDGVYNIFYANVSTFAPIFAKYRDGKWFNEYNDIELTPIDVNSGTGYFYDNVEVVEEAPDNMTAAKLHRESLVQQAVDDGRALVTVRVISAIDDIPGADLIKVAQVEGWKVVVKAGEFKAGDLCVFFEVDSFLPLDDERYAFLEKNKITWQGVEGARLKTIRLRKQLSQGLALPLSLFPEIEEEIDAFHKSHDQGEHAFDHEDVRGLNFTGTLGIMKWDKPVSAQLAGMAKGNFPSFLRKSDQERAQNMVNQIFGYETITVDFDYSKLTQEVLNEGVAAGRMVQTRDGVADGQPAKYVLLHKAQADRETEYEVTLKMDGSSMTVYTHEDQLGVCSRNLDLKIEGNEDNAFVQMAQSGIFKLMELFKLETGGGEFALQGELMGPGIQGNREGFAFNRFFVYNVFQIDTGEFMLPDDRHKLIKVLNLIGAKHNVQCVIEHVPVLCYKAKLSDTLGITNLADLLKYAIGPSLVHKVREGVVFKAVDGKHQFKVISDLYLEQEK